MLTKWHLRINYVKIFSPIKKKKSLSLVACNGPRVTCQGSCDAFYLSLRPTAQPRTLPQLRPPPLQWAASQRPHKPQKKSKHKNHWNWRKKMSGHMPIHTDGATTRLNCPWGLFSENYGIFWGSLNSGTGLKHLYPNSTCFPLQKRIFRRIVLIQDFPLKLEGLDRLRGHEFFPLPLPP